MDGKRPDEQSDESAEAGSKKSVNPSTHEQRKRDKATESRSDGRMTDDEKVDEASEDSFPASDPPGYP